ncbi:hypothetical protein Unana1_07600 [Umbelopsis nana]
MSEKAPATKQKLSFGTFQSTDDGLGIAAMVGSKSLVGAAVLASAVLPRSLAAVVGVIILASAYRNAVSFTFKSFFFPKKVEPMSLREQREAKLDTNSTEPVMFRVAPVIEGDFCVFLIGLRMNNFATAQQAKWMGDAMQEMLSELQNSPDLGCLNADTYVTLNPLAGSTFFVVQYWRSYDKLVEYARGKDLKHYPAWMRVVKEGKQNGAIAGIWHEAFKVREGEYEGVYINTPPMGLGKVGLVPAIGKMTTSKGRTGATDGKDFIAEANDAYTYADREEKEDTSAQKCPVSGAEGASCPVAH